MSEAAPVPDAARVATLRANLARVRAEIAAAATAAGRDPDELTLVAVSKTWPAPDVVALVELGVVHFAENREQEATPKATEVGVSLAGHAVPAGHDASAGHLESAGHGAPAGPLWHFVGQLQTNKAVAVAAWADVVQSVDRERLVGALSRAAVRHGRVLGVCLQVSLDLPFGATEVPAGGRGGVVPSQVVPLAAAVAAADGLELLGVMGVAPRGEPARPAFARLRQVSETLVRDHPEATVVSAGMSGDFVAAVAEGATHLRIGTALFGERPPVP